MISSPRRRPNVVRCFAKWVENQRKDAERSRGSLEADPGFPVSSIGIWRLEISSTECYLEACESVRSRLPGLPRPRARPGFPIGTCARRIQQVALGQADDLGGGVFKKRLNENRHRSIVLAKAGEFWVFAYLFAKQDRANIDEDELEAFRKLAELYRRKTAKDLEAELSIGALLEICHDDEA